MTKTRRIITSLVALSLVICTVICTCLPTSAATRSSGIQTRTITVKTSENWSYPGSESITLSQSKGVCTRKTYNFFSGKTTVKKSNRYGDWDVTVKATDGSHSFKKSFNGSSIKLNLKPNKTYNITVSWDSQSNLFTELDKGPFTTYPTWRVKSTWKVSSYY